MTLSVQTFSPAQAAAVAPGAPVVLLHGFASTGNADWISTGWPDGITDAGRTAVVIDLPGHGANRGRLTDTESATTTAVVAALSATIDDALAATGATHADVIAYSLGARLAWELPGANPRVRRLVLGGISPFEPFAQLDTDELRGVVAGSAAPSSPLVGMMAQMVSVPGNDAGALTTLIDGLAREPFQPGRHADGATPSGSPQGPTLFVAGSDDMMTGGIESLVELVPGGTLVRVPGDHRGALDSAEFRAAALEFIS